VSRAVALGMGLRIWVKCHPAVCGLAAVYSLQLLRPMRISAIILSFNSAQFVERAVRSLAAELGAGDESDEIWVVDNGSTDRSPEILRDLEGEFSGLLRCLYLDTNHGTTASRNLALRQSSGRLILLMDSDIEIPTGTLEPLISVCESSADCGIVVPELRYPSGRVQMSTDRFPTLGRKLKRLLFLRSMEADWESYSQPTAVDYAISAFWLIRRQIFEQVGYLDERIFYSPEDVDYCLRVWKAGYQVCIEPRVFAIHRAQELSRGLRFPGFAASHVRGLVYLFWKHRYLWSLRRLYRAIGRDTSSST